MKSYFCHFWCVIAPQKANGIPLLSEYQNKIFEKFFGSKATALKNSYIFLVMASQVMLTIDYST